MWIKTKLNLDPTKLALIEGPIKKTIINPNDRENITQRSMSRLKNSLTMSPNTTVNNLRQNNNIANNNNNNNNNANNSINNNVNPNPNVDTAAKNKEIPKVSYQQPLIPLSLRYTEDSESSSEDEYFDESSRNHRLIRRTQIKSTENNKGPKTFTQPKTSTIIKGETAGRASPLSPTAQSNAIMPNAENEVVDLVDDKRHDEVENELEKYYQDFSDLDTGRHYAIRIFNTDDTFATLSYPPTTTVEELLPALKRKFNVPHSGRYRISLKVGKLSKLLKPSAKPILIERKLLLLNGYKKSDPLHIMGIEDLSFVFKFIFHPVTPSSYNEQEESLAKSDFVHVDLRNMDLTTLPIVFYQHTSDIESLDVSTNANILLPKDFIESAIKLTSLRMVNMRASKFPSNITEAYKLVSLELQRNFIRRIPNDIHHLNNLTILNLQCNDLSDLPQGFDQLQNLQLLDLSSNKFSHYPEVINSCAHLLQVDLSYNKIQSLPSSINQLKKIAKINLSHNKLTIINDLSGMKNLRTLNLRFNRIAHLKSNSSTLQNLFLTDNRIAAFEDSLPKLRTLELQENPITSIGFTSIDSTKLSFPTNMTSLSLSKAKLASVPGDLFKNLPYLEKLELNENNLSRLPVEITYLTKLVYLSVARNKLEFLPTEFSSLKSLRSLDIHSNNVREFFVGMENIELTYLNISSNVFGNLSTDVPFYRNLSVDSKLAKSLMFFIAADNQFDDGMWSLFNCFTNLKVLNLSYNNFADVSFLRLANLSELYLSGNKLTALPGDTVLHWKALKTLMVNGNQLLTLPAELSQLQHLTIFDIGSNQLKYNISNHHYDWNWGQNKDLKYLNFSGNRRFEIKSFVSNEIDTDLSDLTVLPQLKVLGLMDVTINTSKVPDENINFRLRTTASMINGMRYGVADTLGQRNYVCSRDVTIERFRGNDDECLLCLHDSKNQSADYGHNISRIVRDIYDKILLRQLEKYGDSTDEEIMTALRFSFLQLNKEINGMLNSVDNGTTVANLTSADLLSGACSTVIYIKGKKLYCANIGDCMAVISKNNGDYRKLTTDHIPTKREEYERIRLSGGYVNNGKLDGVVDVSRAVGFFDLLPHIHASPDISVTELNSSDEMLVLGTHRVWEYMDIESVCDITRENTANPMVVAEELKDHAIAYGCSDNITIMCVSLYRDKNQQDRFTLNKNSLMTRRTTFEDTTLRRLQPEIAPPTGNLAVVFTDIKSSTSLWESFPDAMRTAIKTHNDIMRRQLRIYGGYEVKTEGDAFMVTFPTPTSAMVWCLSVQLKLLDAEWPEEITSSQDGCSILDSTGTKIYKGLSVRMGVHWGCPVPELDMVTQRMDYLGPVVNKAARVSSVADGGQIALSVDFCSEFQKILKLHERVTKGKEQVKEVYGDEVIGEVLERELSMLESIGWVFFDFGEHQLKGLENKEFITMVYPTALASRHEYAIEEDENNGLTKDFVTGVEAISQRLNRILGTIQASLSADNSWQAMATPEWKPNTNVVTGTTEAELAPIFAADVFKIELNVANINFLERTLQGLDINSQNANKAETNIFDLLRVASQKVHEGFDEKK